MVTTRYRVLFEKVKAAEGELLLAGDELTTESVTVEMDEIRELRRIVSDITEPPGRSYTTT